MRTSSSAIGSDLRYPHAPRNQAFVKTDVIVCHSSRGKAILECFPAARTTQLRYAFDRAYAFIDRSDEETRAPVVDDLGDGAMRVGDDGSSARHRFDHHESERLRPVDGKQQRTRVAQEVRLGVLTDLADALDDRIVEKRANLLVEIAPVGRIDLRGDLQRNLRPPRDLDGTIDALFGGKPAD